MRFESRIRTYCDGHYHGEEYYSRFSASTYKDAWEYVMDLRRVTLEELGVDVDVYDNVVEYDTENQHHIMQEIELYNSDGVEIPFTWSIEPLWDGGHVTIGDVQCTHDGLYKITDIQDHYVTVIEVDADMNVIGNTEINITFNRLKNWR